MQPSITSVAQRLFPNQDIRKLLCPFHEDHHPGSFHLFDRNNAYKCFSCGAFGHTADLVKQVKHCSDSEAFAFIHGTKAEKKNKVIHVKEGKEEYSAVYDAFMTCYPLNDQHKKYLHQRHIQIHDKEYCSMPQREQLPFFLEHVDPEKLYKVPGFYRYKESGQIGMVQQKGIGIAIKDVHGKIQGIQIRKDILERDEPRYIWFSSDWIKGNEKASRVLEGGNSPGAPIDVLPAVNYSELVITEGHFKASRVHDEFHCSALSVQGMGNYAGILDSLHFLKPSCIYIAYDSDICVNSNVYVQLEKLVHLITDNSEYPVQILVFSYLTGKGIDDVLNTENYAIYAVPAEYYFAFYRQYILLTEKLHMESREDKIEIYELLALKTIYKKEFLKSEFR